MANSVYQNFMPVFFKANGLTAGNIGALSAAMQVVALLSQPLFGILSDKSKTKNRVLKLILAASAVCTLFFFVSSGFWPLLAIVAVNAFFFTSVAPLGDTITLEGLSKNGYAFGPIRMMGAVSFALTAMIAGQVFGRWPEIVRQVYTSLMALLFFASFVLPRAEGHGRKSGGKVKWSLLLRNRELVWLMVCTLLMMTPMAFFYALFSVHFTSGLGGSQEMLGWCFFISAMSEVPFLLLSDRLFKKLGPGKMLLLSCVALAARWLLLGLTHSPAVAMWSQVLHGWCFIVMSFTMVKYVSVVAPPELKASAQMLYSVVGMTLSRIAGSALGGALAENMGIEPVFLMGAVMTAAVFGLLFALLRAKKISGDGNVTPMEVTG